MIVRLADWQSFVKKGGFPSSVGCATSLREWPSDGDVSKRGFSEAWRLGPARLNRDP